jgi:hypothetical protein
MSDEIKKDEQAPEVKTAPSGEPLAEKELSAEDGHFCSVYVTSVVP